MPEETEGDIRKNDSSANNGELPRENSQEGTPDNETTDSPIEETDGEVDDN